MTDQHPLTETAAEVTDDMVAVAIRTWFDTATGTDEGDMRAALSAALAVAAPADPHHDPRPWQDCTLKDIRKGDLVRSRVRDLLSVGIAHDQHADGDWRTEGHRLLTNGDYWPLRRIPAPTPPAIEVELPTEHPAHITDAEFLGGGIVCEYMALDNAGDWCGVSTQGRFHDWRPQDLAAFTLPEGTRARRDGEHEDGTPRFVKVQEGEK